MFSWFGKKPARQKEDAAKPLPTIAQTAAPVMAPGPTTAAPQAKEAMPETVRGKVAFASEARSWEEEFDVVELAAKVLDSQGIFATRNQDTLTLDTSGYVIKPVMKGLQPLDRGRGTQSCTIIRLSHPRLIPAGLHEYQYSSGTTLNESLSKGFEDWTKTDLVPLLDALEDKPRNCTVLQMKIPAKDEQPERRRRMILGPVAHLCANRPDPKDPPEEHPFCACCLLTNTMQQFMPVIQTDGFYGIRLFAMRNADGSASADARINGEEFEPGKEGLRRYIEKWPQRGFEFRKQYVVVQNTPPAADEPQEALPS